MYQDVEGRPEWGAFFISGPRKTAESISGPKKCNRFFAFTSLSMRLPARPGRAGIFNARLIETDKTKNASSILRYRFFTFTFRVQPGKPQK